MPEYREGEVSKSGKYIMRGGQWLPNTGGAGGAAQAPPLSPNVPLTYTPRTDEQKAVEDVAAMPEWKRRLGITALKGLQGVTPSFLHPYLAPQGLDKVEQLIQAGEEKATGTPFGTASTMIPEMAASLPLWGGAQAGTMGLLSKVPGVGRVAAAAQELPGLLKRGASIGEKAKGALARGLTGATAFPAMDVAVRGETPTPTSAAIGAGMGAVLGPGAFRLGKGKAEGTPAAEGPPVTPEVAPVDKEMQAFLGKFAKEQGIKLAPEDAQVVQQAESAITQELADPEFTGPLFGTGEREVISRPPNLQVLRGGQSPGAQGSLFPPAAISPPQYGPGRGPIGPPPPPPESFGGNVPRERLGTETARLKRAITDIERLRAIMGAK